MFPDSRGFTLVEVLVSMVILLLGLLGSLMGTMAALDYNMGHVLQEEAVKIAQEQVEINRNINYAAIAEGDTASQVQRQIRKSNKDFQVTRSVQTTGTLKTVNVQVQWTFKNRNKSYSLQTIIRQPV